MQQATNTGKQARNPIPAQRQAMVEPSDGVRAIDGRAVAWPVPDALAARIIWQARSAAVASVARANAVRRTAAERQNGVRDNVRVVMADGGKRASKTKSAARMPEPGLCGNSLAWRQRSDERDCRRAKQAGARGMKRRAEAQKRVE